MTILDNVESIRETIQQAKRTSRYIENPQILVVTKQQVFEDISQLYTLGFRSFAENRVDAILKRQEEFPQEDIEWHLIGTLQTRKVKDIIDKIDYFHALDRQSLIDEIDKRATKCVKCFLQVNAFHEASKQGFYLDEIENILDYLHDKKHILVVGLMVMAPFDADCAVIKRVFQQVKELQLSIKNRCIPYAPCAFLSMGMSNDYKEAVEMGATHLRIGSAFFKN
ncbi:YggS family pyridoxal phosphate-dependent enzyme [Granulicatella sp. zg-ZJ]|uniref:YggS family pyridoxal phosphate-dependent enzyme n=1 Tax=Granulicatella sp. zg-ZJ TaxID=2678504 RepID=UPI0013D7CAF8|nr:YggS family pyridoxal phosphate-dependent enzyme [Granulicatella sp. zg-ZJ]NEW62938.1 YggS family pyridoxal phosphate-dependent enzyme [Granulicatella sp. zg-ZJ]